MRTLIAGAVLATAWLLPLPASSASTIIGSHVGCLTEESFDEFVRAIRSKDARQAKALIATVCMFLRGRDYSLVEGGFFRSRIRVYSDHGSVVLWVSNEAIP